MEEAPTRTYIPHFLTEYFSAKDLALYDAVLMWERIPRKKKKQLKRDGKKYKEFLDARAAERIRIALNKGATNFYDEVKKITKYLNQ